MNADIERELGVQRLTMRAIQALSAAQRDPGSVREILRGVDETLNIRVEYVLRLD